MSADPGTHPERLGVVATWRLTPTSAKALLAGVFVNRLGGFLQIFLILFLTERGFSAGQAGLALGVEGAGGVLGTLLGGYLSDRISARSATLISMLGSAALLVSILYVSYYPALLVVVLLVGVVGQIYRPAAQAMITELVPRAQLVMVTAMYRLCLNLGTTAAPLVGVALLMVSYDLLFWAEALAAVTYGLIAVRYLPRRGRPGGAPAEPETEPEPEPAGPGEPARSGYLAVFSDFRYVCYLGAVFLIIMVHVQYTTTLPLAIADAELSLWWYGAVVTLNAALVVTCEVPATRWVQAWPLPVIAVFGFGLFALGYGIYAIAIVPVFLILGTLIWTSSEIIGGPTTNAYPGLVAPAHLRGRYFGAMQSAIGIGFTVGPILGVFLWSQVGQAVWLWTAGVAVLASLLALIGMRYRDPTTTAATGPVRAPAPTAEAEPAS